MLFFSYGSVFSKRWCFLQVCLDVVYIYQAVKNNSYVYLILFAALICNAELNELNEGIFPHQLFSDLFLSVIIYTKIGN